MPTRLDAPLPIRTIANDICAEHRISLQRLLGTGRDAEEVAARRHAWWRIRQLVGPGGNPHSYTRMGYWFNRDHTTVLVGVREYKKLVESGLAPN